MEEYHLHVSKGEGQRDNSVLLKIIEHNLVLA